MKFTTFALSVVTVIAMVAPMANSHAGVYTDNLSECLVKSTSRQDRLALANWLYSAASFHPAVKSVASVSRDQLDTANKKSAELFVRLLTESCKGESEKALKLEGHASIQGSFHALGQVASEELFSDSEVLTAASGLDEFLDKTRLRALIQTE